jgi:NAD+ diphosphatase
MKDAGAGSLKQAPGEGRDVGFAFAYDAIDRAAHLRENADVLALMLADESSRLCLVHKDSLLVHRNEDKARALFSMSELRTLGPHAFAINESASLCDLIFLGRRESAALFCVVLNSADEWLASNSEWMLADLRALATGGLLAQDDLAAMASAKSLAQWHQSHGFCAHCGARTQMTCAGWRRDCPACGKSHFPRTDPVVIMMVTDGDHCLLGRQTRFPEGMWSCLAGFVEPGETIEDAVRREIHEEAGIICDDISYFASQPWPYPSSLMIGCRARALTQEIVVDRNELEDARWFSRDEVRRMFDGQHEAGLKPPHPFAIAHHLLAEWLNDENGRP